MSLAELWTTLKPILEVGAVGSMAVAMFWVWLRKDREIKSLQEKRVEEQKEHKKEILTLQSLYTREITEITRHYDKALLTVTVLMDRIVNYMEE